MILWFGWYGFNSGSALLTDSSGNGDTLAARAGTNTTLAAGAAGITALFMNYLVLQRLHGQGRYDVMVTANGVIGGLVSATSMCSFVEPWAAVLTGGVAGILYLLASWALVHYRLDDAVDAIPVHLACGMLGLIASGLFAKPDYLMQAYGRANHPGLFYSTSKAAGGDGFDGTLLASQIIGILFIVGWTSGIMLPFFMFLERFGYFRADALAEVAGLDKAYFGGEQHAGGDDELSPEVLSKLTKQLEHHQIHHRKGRSSSDKESTGNHSGSKSDLINNGDPVEPNEDKYSKNV